MRLANKELLSDLLKKDELVIGILQDESLEIKIESISKRVRIENKNQIEEIINYAIKKPTKDNNITANIKLDFNTKENIYINLTYHSKEQAYNLIIRDYKKMMPVKLTRIKQNKKTNTEYSECINYEKLRETGEKIRELLKEIYD